MENKILQRQPMPGAGASESSAPASPSIPDTSSTSSSLHFTSKSPPLTTSSPHHQIGLSPSSPSLLSSSEARSSRIHYIQPPPHPSGLSPIGSTPSTAPLSRPFARRHSSLQQTLLPHHSLQNDQPFHSPSASSTPESFQSTNLQTSRQSLQTPPNKKQPSPRIAWPFARSVSEITPQKAQGTPTYRTLSVVAIRDPSPEVQPSTTSTTASSPALSTISTIRPDYYDPKPFARRSAPPSAYTSLSAPLFEDINSFESRLTRTLSSELAQISFRDNPDIVDDMGLARSFTKHLGRPASVDASQAKTSRPQISNPMGLISTTNQWVHDVPNISDLHVKEVQQRQFSSSSSRSSAHVSDSETSPTSEPPSMTDTSSVESFSPIEPNHLTPYFVAAPAPLPSKSLSVVAAPSNPAMSPSVTPTSEPEKLSIATPSLPARSVSHSKREHERLARARSFRSSTGSSELMSHSQHNSLTASLDGRISHDLLLPMKSSSRPTSTVVEESAPFSPFSRELRQLDEVAEDFRPGAHEAYMAEGDVEDQRVMQELGLKSYRVSEYLSEIARFREGLWALIEEEEEDEEEFRTAWI